MRFPLFIFAVMVMVMVGCNDADQTPQRIPNDGICREMGMKDAKSVHCEHPSQTLMQDGDMWVCRCPKTK